MVWAVGVSVSGWCVCVVCGRCVCERVSGVCVYGVCVFSSHVTMSALRLLELTICNYFILLL